MYKYRIFKSFRLRIVLIVIAILIYLRFFDMDMRGMWHISAGTAVALVFGMQSLLVLLFPKYMEEVRRREIEFFSPIRKFFPNGWKT